SAYSTAVTPSSRARRSANLARMKLTVVLSRSIRLHLLPPEGATGGATAQRHVPLSANVGLAIGKTRPFAGVPRHRIAGEPSRPRGHMPIGSGADPPSV